MLLKFLKRRFPLQATSIDKFIELLQQNRATSVQATSYSKPTSHKETGGMVPSVEWEYSTVLTSETLNGRPIVFKDILGYRNSGHSRGFENDTSRRKAYLSGVIRASNRLSTIKSRLSYVETSIEGISDEHILQRLLKEARDCEVTEDYITQCSDAA